eukprot:141682-Pyramimonas_sp.AAC.1
MDVRSRGSRNHHRGQCTPCCFVGIGEPCPRGGDCDCCHYHHGLKGQRQGGLGSGWGASTPNRPLIAERGLVISTPRPGTFGIVIRGLSPIYGQCVAGSRSMPPAPLRPQRRGSTRS